MDFRQAQCSNGSASRSSAYHCANSASISSTRHACVHQAILDLLREENWDELSLPRVAERSSVHKATLYRRWGTVNDLINDVVTEHLSQGSPLPDTGTLRSDLEAYPLNVADDVASPLGSIYLRAAMVGSRGRDGETYLIERAVDLQAMLDRAAARGEQPPTLLELIEVVIAPLYYHAFFFTRPIGHDHAKTLVDRLLILPGSAP